MAAAFAAHALSRQAPQLLIDQGHELFEGRFIPSTPLQQQFRDVSRHSKTWQKNKWKRIPHENGKLRLKK
jgi:hypothetical protein